MHKTYKEWKADGRQVIRGSKATSRNANLEPTFSHEQTKPQRDSMASVGDYDYEYEGSWEEMLGGWDWYK